MDRRVALALALTCAGLAVAIVAADLQFNVTVSLETMRDGEWVVVASDDTDGFASPRYPGSFVGCAGPDVRVVVDNGLPWQTAFELRIIIVAYDSGRTETIVAEALEIERGASATVGFTVPGWAGNGTADPAKPAGPAYVEVMVDETYLSTCVVSA